MIPVTHFAGRKVGVLGLAKSGRAAALALLKGGTAVMAWDDGTAAREAAARDGIPLVDLGAAELDAMAALVLSPGIPHTHPKPHPVAARCRAAGVPIIGDIELLALTQRDARYVGITGTNGKSTTTALLGHVLAECGVDVAVGGNLGTPALSLAPLGADGTYVLEMSSYQLELTESLGFAVAILLNVTPDHLDRHGGMAGYVAAKERIFRNAPAGAAAIVGIDDEICRGVAARLRGAGHDVVAISAEGAPEAGVAVEGDALVDRLDGKARRVLDLARLPRLPGTHNAQNVAAAWAAARRLGLEPAAIAAAISSFPGLPHRQELVATMDGVRYVNDSKATNADAAAKALVCYRDIYWIAGGLAKEGGIAALAPLFPRIRHAFLIGEAAEAFADTLGSAVPHSRTGDLATAVRAAHALARRERRKGAVVLLSPACASFDQFANFEARGDAFRQLVAALPSTAEAGA